MKLVLQVSAGGWKGEIPAPENVEIINYLNIVRPTPSDEQYLPAFCDVVALLQQLLGLGGGVAGVGQAVRKIVGAVLESEVATREVKIVREALEKLEALVREEGEEGAKRGEEEGATEGKGGEERVENTSGEKN